MLLVVSATKVQAQNQQESKALTAYKERVKNHTESVFGKWLYPERWLSGHPDAFSGGGTVSSKSMLTVDPIEKVWSYYVGCVDPGLRTEWSWSKTGRRTGPNHYIFLPPPPRHYGTLMYHDVATDKTYFVTINPFVSTPETGPDLGLKTRMEVMVLNRRAGNAP